VDATAHHRPMTCPMRIVLRLPTPIGWQPRPHGPDQPLVRNVRSQVAISGNGNLRTIPELPRRWCRHDAHTMHPVLTFVDVSVGDLGREIELLSDRSLSPEPPARSEALMPPVRIVLRLPTRTGTGAASQRSYQPLCRIQGVRLPTPWESVRRPGTMPSSQAIDLLGSLTSAQCIELLSRLEAPGSLMRASEGDGAARDLAAPGRRYGAA
jgi:hypothetical protein